MRKRALSLGAEEEIHAYLASRPPPPLVESWRTRVEAHLSDSTIRDLRELQKQQRAADVGAIATRFEVEQERRRAAEGELKTVRDRWWTIVTGVVVLVVAAAIVWAVETLVVRR